MMQSIIIPLLPFSLFANSLALPHDVSQFPLAHDCANTPIPPAEPASSNTTCILALKGYLRIPEAINAEDAFARVDYISSSLSSGFCAPVLKSYHAGDNESSEPSSGKDRQDEASHIPNRPAKWTFNVCGAELQILLGQDGVKAWINGTSDSRGGMLQDMIRDEAVPSGELAVKGEMQTVWSCCGNKMSYADVESWPFCRYLDWRFEVCQEWEEEED